MGIHWINTRLRDDAFFRSHRVWASRLTSRFFVCHAHDRAPGKRKHEEVDEYGPVSESEFYEDTESDDSASSSDSDTSDSEKAVRNWYCLL